MSLQPGKKVRKLAGVCVSVALVSTLFTGRAFPWGGRGHSLVNEFAVDNLPAEMVDDGTGNAFGDMRDYLRDHSSDPDLQKGYDAYESFRHWCDIDSQLAAYPPPFDTVPRDYDAYVSIFGRENGVVQWEGISAHYDSLVELMRARNWPMAYQRSAELGHYVADATCPLHATVHYDGYREWHPLYDARNQGIHERYESEMVDRYIDSIETTPASATYVADCVEMGFGTVSTGWELFDDVNAADLEVQDIVGDGNFNDQYYEGLYDRTGQDARERLALAARRLADLWYSAWVDAGCPSFAAAATKVNFQPLGAPAPPGWGCASECEYGPFGPYGWQ